MSNKFDNLSSSNEINNIISVHKLEKYFEITLEALEKVKVNLDYDRMEQAKDFLNMAECYYKDALFFKNKKNDYVLAFAALNYAHGWLDAGARIGLFKVKDNRLFTVDSE